MAEVTIVYWRDIPAQVIVGKGRRGVKRPLPERFEQAIDRAAMKVGAAGTDAYLAEWRKADPYTVEGEDEAVATARDLAKANPGPGCYEIRPLRMFAPGEVTR